jgi:hypothetical protein
MSTRAIWRAALRTGWSRRSLVSLVAVGLVASACSSSDSVDASALPKIDAPRLALAVDANLANDLPPFNDGNGHGEPSGTSYRIGAMEPESLVTAALDDTLPPDQIVEASFTTNDSPKDSGYGVVCRRRDNDNYYRLGVGNDGTFAIARVRHGTSTVLTGGGKWVRDRRLIDAPGTFTVRGECRGPTLRLFMDNQPIIQIADAVFDRPGGVGVFVETFALPNATITVNRLSARGFVDRSRVTDATALRWDALLRSQRVTNRCALLEPKRIGAIGGASFVSKCGTTLLVQLPDAASATREYKRMLERGGTSLEKVKQLPDCSQRTGVQGPLPPPTPPAGVGDQRTSIGRVACLDLGDTTAVVWLHQAAGIIGVVRVRDNDRAAWRDYGRDWKPFSYVEQPG